MPVEPACELPADLLATVAEDGYWEDDQQWYPMTVSVTADTEYDQQAVPLAWQVELPVHRLEQLPGSSKGEFDGYAWSAAIADRVSEQFPEISDQLHFGDTESATGVVWTESREAFEKLLKVAWSLIHGRAKPS